MITQPADKIDRASELEEMQRTAAIAAQLNTPQPRKTGFCQWCKEPTTGVYCCSECEHDHAQARHFKGR